MTTYSPLESARFGLRMGRLTVAAETSGHALIAVVERALHEEELDVLIVRAPARDVTIPVRLTAIDGYRAVPADTLMYWEWSPGQHGAPSGAPGRVVRLAEQSSVERLVRAVFPGYPNHYAANPLLSQEDALEGYCEWASSLVASGSSTCLVLTSEDDRDVGFGIIDWAPPVPDIRLAGIVPEFRGRGAYRTLVEALMAETTHQGRDSLHISTQAHNIAPMRTWASLGWKPATALITIHLIRSDRLSPA